MKLRKFRILLPFLVSIACLSSCCCPEPSPKLEEKLDGYEEGEELPIGKFSSGVYNAQAFGNILPYLSTDQRADFGIGDRLFMKTFSPQLGLGPRFNARACSNCHFRDGRGKPLNGSTDSDPDFSRGFLIRLSVKGENSDGAPQDVKEYGGQLQDRGLKGFGAEAKVSVTYEKITRTYADGTIVELEKPIYTFYDEKFGSLEGVMTSPRVGTQTIGFGFLDALTEDQILKNADEQDLDKDGISGRANYVWNVRAQKKTIGKFGWKANAPTLEQQIAGALNGDMGITTSIFPKESCNIKKTEASDIQNDGISNGKIEFSDVKLTQITAYQATLSVPIRKKARHKNVLQGKALFHKMKCIKCHAVGFKVKKYDLVPQIAGTVVNPYSDLLLHDMGEDLADNRPDNLANGKEWRTQPLWGISMIKTVNGHTRLLHDGRAKNIEEAILWHGGEAENSRKEFMNLTKKERDKVIAFVNSL